MSDPAPALVDRRVIVAGCTGQVGRPLARALAADNVVHGVARFADAAARAELEAAGVICHPVNLVDPDLGGAGVPAEVDHLLNFAVTKTGRWDLDLAANAEGAGHLMAHLEPGATVLHCSTTAVYAPSDGATMTEDSPLGRDHHQHVMPTYSTAKTATESVVRFVARDRGLPTTIARLNVPYGDDGGWPLFQLLCLLEDQPIVVHPDGSTYHPIHHDDLVAQVPALLAAASVPATTVNWGGDEAVSMVAWTDELSRLIGTEPRYVTVAETIPSAPVDPARRRAITGPCTVDWRTGMRRLAATIAPDRLSD